MRYRVEMVCFVEVPDTGYHDGVEILHGDEAAFALAFNEITDDEADEVWICEAPEKVT